MDKIAVLIPCYNEEKTIAGVIRAFKQELPDSVIYVYDNNSTDKTAEIAEKCGAVVRRERIQGKGCVIRRMFREIDAECYLMVDGDDTYPAEYAHELCSAVLERNVDMAIGDRLSSTYFTENKRLFHNSGNKLVRALINTIYKSKIRDVMTGYRAFSYEFVKTFPVLSGGFEIETEMTIHALDKKLATENIIIEYRDRPDGSFSKLNTYTDGLSVLKTILLLYKNYKPLSFFSIIAFLFLLFAVVLLIPVLIEYAQTGLVPKFPSLITSGVFGLAALQSLVGGLILDTIANKNRQDFEINYINCFEKKCSLLDKDKA